MSKANQQVGVMLSTELVTALDQAARAMGLNRSAYIRQLLIEVLSK